MEPIYVIQNGLGMQENSLKIFPDRILIQKPKERKSTKMDVIKKELRLQGLMKSEYIGIDVPFSKIDSVYFRPATSNIFKNGLIVFYIIGNCCNRGGVQTRIYEVNSWSASCGACAFLSERQGKERSELV